jgi:hypothetical protein
MIGQCISMSDSYWMDTAKNRQILLVTRGHVIETSKKLRQKFFKQLGLENCRNHQRTIGKNWFDNINILKNMHLWTKILSPLII